MLGYNGSGNCLQQIANGQTAKLYADLNAGLTQVLGRWDGHILVRRGRIAQERGGGMRWSIGCLFYVPELRS